jgi:hypothetical protein
MCNFDLPDLAIPRVDIFQRFGVHFSRYLQGEWCRSMMRSDISQFASLFVSRESGQNVETRIYSFCIRLHCWSCGVMWRLQWLPWWSGTVSGDAWNMRFAIVTKDVYGLVIRKYSLPAAHLALGASAPQWRGIQVGKTRLALCHYLVNSPHRARNRDNTGRLTEPDAMKPVPVLPCSSWRWRPQCTPKCFNNFNIRGSHALKTDIAPLLRFPVLFYCCVMFHSISVMIACIACSTVSLKKLEHKYQV